MNQEAARSALARALGSGLQWSHWDPPERSPALKVLPALTQPRSCVFLAKEPVFRFMQQHGPGWPADVMVIERPGLLTHAVYTQVVRNTQGGPIKFMGDLHPFAMLVYLSLGVGGVDAPADFLASTPVTWVGIGDTWLDLCERTLLDEHRTDWGRFGPPVVPKASLDDLGRHLLDVVDTGTQVDETLGVHCAKMLRNGKAMSMDSACNVSLYNDTFVKQLTDHILSQLYGQ